MLLNEATKPWQQPHKKTRLRVFLILKNQGKYIYFTVSSHPEAKTALKYLEYGDIMVPNTLQNTMLENMAWIVFVNKGIIKPINNSTNGPHVSEKPEACDFRWLKSRENAVRVSFFTPCLTKLVCLCGTAHTMSLFFPLPGDECHLKFIATFHHRSESFSRLEELTSAQPCRVICLNWSLNWTLSWQLISNWDRPTGWWDWVASDSLKKAAQLIISGFGTFPTFNLERVFYSHETLQR